MLGTDGSTLVVTAYTVNDGNGGGNYTVTTTDATGTITPQEVTGSFTAAIQVLGRDDGGDGQHGVGQRRDHRLDVVNLGYTGGDFANSAIGTWTSHAHRSRS